MTEKAYIHPCSKPKPTYWDGKKGSYQMTPYFLCDECGFILGLIEYESNGTRLRWWRHSSERPPAMAMAVVS